MKVAIVHYWLIAYRGGEKVVHSLLKVHPDAHVYAMFADPDLLRERFPGVTVHTSWFDRPFIRKYYQALFPFYPLFLWALRLKGDYDLVISSESGPAKGIKRKRAARHICYVHTPMRYAWGFTSEYLRVLPYWSRPIARFLFSMLRRWDSTTVANVDAWLCNSGNVRDRIARYYGKQATVIYPPIEDRFFESFSQARLIHKRKGAGYFLCFGALVPYKRIDLAVSCFNRNGLPLQVFGSGGELQRLHSMSKPNVSVHGSLADSELIEVIAQARALIFPGEEDFGMIPVEVMALGVPVIAYKAGGALETVVENPDPALSTGVFFDQQTVESLDEAVNRFLAMEHRLDHNFIHHHARSFSESRFLAEMRKVL